MSHEFQAIHVHFHKIPGCWSTEQASKLVGEPDVPLTAIFCQISTQHITAQHRYFSVESRGSSCYTGPIPTRSAWSPSTASISEWRERAACTARGSTSRTSLARVPVAFCGSNWVNRAAVGCWLRVVLRINTVHGRSWIVREGIPQMRIAFAHVLAQSLRAG